MSIRNRLTLFYSLSIILIAVLLVSAFIWALIHAVANTADEVTRTHAELAAALLRAGDRLDQTVMPQLTTGNTAIIARDGQGRVVVQSREVLFDADSTDTDIWRHVLATGQSAAGEASLREDSQGTVRDDFGDDVRIYAVPVNVPGTPIRVIEAMNSYSQIGKSGFIYELYLIVFVVALIVLAIVVGYLLAWGALRPVNTIVRSVEQTSAEDLSRRLPIRNRRDELGRLSATFNELLCRLEVAFKAREDALAHERRFVADASHELRTPLTSIVGYIRMLRDWGLGDPATAEEATAAIEREAARMSSLVDGLLSLARGDERAHLERSRNDLVEIASEVVTATRTAAGNRLTIVEQLPSEPIVVLIDRDRIHQLAGILLDNAVKYTEPGGTVTISIRVNDDYAELEVRDTGIGIAGSDLRKVFDRFYRVDEARAAGGTGLGLSIARQIADAHDATIEVESQPWRGSTFTLRLPSPQRTMKTGGESVATSVVN